MCLMKTPRTVASMVSAAVAAVDTPITVKCRLGVDEYDSYEHLNEFVRGVVEAGAARLIIHARKGLLRGLNPAQNRSVPPLRYEWVSRLMDDFPDAKFELNGGVKSLAHAREIVELYPKLDGVMLGRAVWNDPLLLAGVDATIFGDPCPAPRSRRSVITDYVTAFDHVLSNPGARSSLTAWEPIINLFAATPVSRRYRTLVHSLRTDPRFRTPEAVANSDAVVGLLRFMDHEDVAPVADAVLGQSTLSPGSLVEGKDDADDADAAYADADREKKPTEPSFLHW